MNLRQIIRHELCCGPAKDIEERLVKAINHAIANDFGIFIFRAEGEEIDRLDELYLRLTGRQKNGESTASAIYESKGGSSGEE